MENHIIFLQDFAAVMVIASIAMLILHFFKQPVILGYIITGFLLGPHTPTILGIGLKNEETLNTMSEMAIVLLMFSLGLEFSIRKLRQVGMPATVAATTEIIVMFITGCVAGKIFGLSIINCLFLGAILATSSTMVISKTLADLQLLKERFAGIIIGIAVVEDIVCISLMAILTSIALTGSFGVGLLTGTFAKLGLFFVIALVAGLLLVPRLMNYVEKTEKTEFILIIALGLCFGVALLAESLGYSTALGAFIIGALIAETHGVQKVEKTIQPIKDMFSAIFFVVVGTMIDPVAVVHYLPQILILSVVVLVMKTAACALGSLLTGNPFPTSMKVGLGMCNVGEVSFIILSLGMSLNVLDKSIYPIGVTVSILTMVLTPFIFNRGDRIIVLVKKFIPKSIMQAIGVYINWYQQRGKVEQDISVLLGRKFFIQNVINLGIVTAILIIAAFLAEWIVPSLNSSLVSTLVLNLIWLVAFIICVPFLMSSQQNHAALSYLLVSERIPERATEIRHSVQRVISLFGFSCLGVYVTILIAALIQRDVWKYIYILVFIAALVGYLLRNYFNRIYQDAQIEIETILNRTAPPEEKKEKELDKSMSILHNDTRVIIIQESSPCVNRSIRDLNIRYRSGATIISIDRDGRMIISPRGEEVFQKGDYVLLLGNTDQLNRAEQLISGMGTQIFEI